METPLVVAFRLIAEADAELVGVTWRSVRIALSSTAIAAVVGLPAAGLLALARFPGRRVILVVSNALMALPTVAVALAVYGIISRSGPLGYLDLLFTPGAVVVGQTILLLPIVVSLATAALEAADPRLRETAISLGAGSARRLLTLLRETAPAISAAVLSGFGRAIGEVGVSMMLGGNIRRYTRTMTTAIALETNRGAFDLAIAMGMMLVVIALGVNGGLRALAELGRSRSRRPTGGKSA